MSVKIAPSPRQQFEDGNGLPYSGAKLFAYVAGSTTKQATYTTSVGDAANSNPIVLDSAGRTPYGVWLTAGLSYKFVLAPSTDTDPPTSPIFTEDNITGVNDTTVSTSQWIASGLTLTYIGATQFSVVGDQTTELHVNRRLKLTVSAGTVYGKISVSTYTTVTTVTVVLDSGALDSGLSSVEWSILSANNNALPKGIFADLTGATFTGPVNLAAGADIASATTIDLTAATGNSPRITGTTPTSAVTMNTGQQVLVVADGAWPLTYHATDNKLSTGGSYTCTAGDMVLYSKSQAGIVHGTILSVTAPFASALLSKISATRGEVLYHNGNIWTSLGVGTSGKKLTTKGTGADLAWEYAAFEGALFRCRDEKSAGIDGGTFTSDAFRTRTLNTVETNEIAGASLGSDQITLPAGTYYIDASVPANVLSVHKAILYNVTDAGTSINGTNEQCNSANISTTRSLVKGRFTLAATKALEIRHKTGVTRATDGFGKATSFAVEVYTEVSIWKVA